MPIAGLTDQDDFEYLRPCGVLKKGAKKRPNAPGEPLPYFRFEGKGAPWQVKRIEKIWNHHFPTPPTQLDVQLVYPIPSKNFSAWFELWSSGNWLKIRCDGVQKVIWHDGEKYRSDPAPCPLKGGEKCPNQCSRVGRLQVFVPQLFREEIWEPVTVQFPGKNDLRRISTQLRYFDTLAPDLRGVPFRLAKLEGQQIFRPGFDGKGGRSDKRGKMEAWLLDLAPIGGWFELLLEQKGERLLLPPEPGQPTTDPGPETVLSQVLLNSDSERRLGELSSMTRCPLRNIRTIVRTRFGCGINDLSDEQIRRVRSELFLLWAEQTYCLSREQSKAMLKEFWEDRAPTAAEDDRQLFEGWQWHVQQWAIECSYEKARHDAF